MDPRLCVEFGDSSLFGLNPAKHSYSVWLGSTSPKLTLLSCMEQDFNTPVRSLSRHGFQVIKKKGSKAKAVVWVALLTLHCESQESVTRFIPSAPATTSSWGQANSNCRKHLKTLQMLLQWLFHYNPHYAFPVLGNLQLQTGFQARKIYLSIYHF